MKKQTIFYFKEQKNLESIREIKLSNIEEAAEQESCVVYGEKKLKIITDEQPENIIKGYISVSKKENKYEKQSLKNVSSAIDGRVAIHKEKGLSESIVGYVKINCDTYAIVKKSPIVIIGLIILLGVLCIGGAVMICNLPKKPVIEVEETESTQVEETESTEEKVIDEKGTGSLDGEEKVTYASEGFRFKINTSPILSDGKMNVRIESPEAENSEFVAIYNYCINAKVDANYNVIEQYDEPINIYTSPEIYGNENLEYATVTTELEEGYYTGVCYCSIYDTNGNFLMTNGAVLKVYCAD